MSFLGPRREHRCRECGHIVTHEDWVSRKYSYPCPNGRLHSYELSTFNSDLSTKDNDSSANGRGEQP